MTTTFPEEQPNPGLINTIFQIGIPTINRADLLNPTLERYVHDFPNTKIWIIDNGQQPLYTHPHITTLLPQKNLGVAGSWNLLCRTMFYGPPSDVTANTNMLLGTRAKNGDPLAPTAGWAWILNDDIYSGMLQKELLQIIGDHFTPPTYGFVSAPKNWSNFLISRECFEVVGDFDEAFYPAYYEDNDYRYRLKLAKIPVIRLEQLEPKVFRVSSSIQKDPSLNHRFQENRDLYRAKWGGVPEEETFRKPFDGKFYQKL